MTEDRVAGIYTELETLAVQIDMAPEKGPAYLLEALTDCRRRQDRAVSLLVEVRRARVASKRRVRALKEEALLVDPVARVSLRRTSLDADDLYDELATLETCVNVMRANLRMADSDIRLAERLMEQQRQLGTIKPPATDPLSPSSGSLGLVDLADSAWGVVEPAAPTASAEEDVHAFFAKTPGKPDEAPAPAAVETMSIDQLLGWMREGKG